MFAFGRHLMIVVATLVVFGITTLVWPIGEEPPSKTLTAAGAKLCFANDETMLIGIILDGKDIGDKEVLQAARVPTLQRLSLVDSRVTRRGIQALQPLAQLSTLNLSRTRWTFETLDLVASLSTLKELRLDECEWVQDHHLTQLAPLKNLQTLGLGGTSITLEGLENLRSFPQLKYLHLDKSQQIDDQWIDALVRLCDDRHLNVSLSWTEISAEGLARLRQTLAKGTVHFRPDSMVGLRGIGERGQFVMNDRGEVWGFRRRLNVDGSTSLLQRGDLAIVGTIANLQELNLDQTNVDDEMLNELPVLPHLETLRLSSTFVSNDGLAVLEKFPNLTSLWLTDCDVDGRGLAQLRHVPRLTNLKIQIHRGDDILSQLQDLTELQMLSITGPLTDDGLAQLVSLPKLRFLGLAGSNVRGPGIAKLAGSTITELRFDDGLVDDTDLDALASLKSIRWLVLFQTGVTRSGRDRLMKLRPDAVVHWTAAP